MSLRLVPFIQPPQKSNRSSVAMVGPQRWAGPSHASRDHGPGGNGAADSRPVAVPLIGPRRGSLLLVEWQRPVDLGIGRVANGKPSWCYAAELSADQPEHGIAHLHGGSQPLQLVGVDRIVEGEEIGRHHRGRFARGRPVVVEAEAVMGRGEHAGVDGDQLLRGGTETAERCGEGARELLGVEGFVGERTRAVEAHGAAEHHVPELHVASDRAGRPRGDHHARTWLREDLVPELPYWKLDAVLAEMKLRLEAEHLPGAD